MNSGISSLISDYVSSCFLNVSRAIFLKQVGTLIGLVNFVILFLVVVAMLQAVEVVEGVFGVEDSSLGMDALRDTKFVL